MTEKLNPTILTAVQTAISDLANLEVHEVAANDHLVNDLFMNLKTDLPAIIRRLQQAGYQLPSRVLADFLLEINQDPDKATVAELVIMIEEELKY